MSKSPLRPKTIVLAMDGSEHAFSAIELLNALPLPDGSQIHVVSVLIPRQAQFATSFTDVLDQTRSRLSGSKASVHTELIAGYPAEIITQYAREHSADLIVMGAKGLRATLGILLGGVAQKVTEIASCPTMVVRAPFQGLARILLVVDESEHAQAALRYLSDFPLPTSVQIHAMHVLPPTYQRELLAQSWPAGMDLTIPIINEDLEAELRAQEAEEHKRGEALLEECVAALHKHGLEAVSHLTRGDAATQIITYAREQDIQLIVAGSRGLGGLESFLLGGVSRKLIHYAPCSVLITRKAKGE